MVCLHAYYITRRQIFLARTLWCHKAKSLPIKIVQFYALSTKIKLLFLPENLFFSWAFLQWHSMKLAKQNAVQILWELFSQLMRNEQLLLWQNNFLSIRLFYRVKLLPFSHRLKFLKAKVRTTLDYTVGLHS